LNKLKIGLDFDNTLVCYDRVFIEQAIRLNFLPEHWSGTKQSIKTELLKSPEGESMWQRLQGQVYGPAMRSAVLFSGVSSFLIRARQKGHKIFIASHKTKYGHQDETKTPLREKALQWMKNKGFFDPTFFGIHRDNVHFCDSRKEKAAKIRELGVDVFIDDLECIFNEDGFPVTKKILFRSSPTSSFEGLYCQSWAEISDEVLGETNEYDCRALLNGVLDEEVKNFVPINSGINSKVFNFFTSSKKSLILKLYPDQSLDPRPRLETEVKALKKLAHLGLTPLPVASDTERNLSVLEFLPGLPPNKIGQSEIIQALNFVKRLSELSKESSNRFELASEACLSAEEIESQIKLRFGWLKNVEHDELLSFLNDDFLPLFKETLSWAKLMTGPKTDWSKKLPVQYRTLSPADFGFHNSIQDETGRLKFIDFEYFGWDDPVKLISEFILHPGMNLNQECKDIWLEGCFSIFGTKDKTLPLRLQVRTPLFALRWSLITLNKFKIYGQGISSSRNSAIPEPDEKLSQKILKAKQLCLVAKTEVEHSYV
jgi:thiamine kinase-like enzyme